MSYPRIQACRITDDDYLVVDIEGNRMLQVPLSELSPRLREATPTQRENLRILPDGKGIHWPDIDEDLSISGMLDTQADRYALSRELAVWKARKAELVASFLGQYVLIVGGQVIGTYPTQQEAIRVGWGQFGRVPIFTRLIQEHEPVMYIG